MHRGERKEGREGREIRNARLFQEGLEEGRAGAGRIGDERGTGGE